MSALWVIPSLALVVGAIVLWSVSRRAAAEAAALRQELSEWDDTRATVGRLRAEAQGVAADYRQLRRR